MAIIELNNINKSYHGHVVLKNFNLRVESNDFVIISGKSGSGKSTICNIIGLLDKPDQGKVIINDQVINYKDREVSEVLRNNISYLFQNFALIDNKTVGYNLELVYLSKKERKRNYKLIQETLAKVKMEEMYDKYIYECSGGQQQRVAIARLLLKKGEIIICDEPTGSLDNDNKEIVMNLINEMHKNGKTIIMVTHDQSLYKYATKIISLDN
ncbi:MAG: ABC transporter ATP-binding protein [Thomasclavelia sp.]